MIGGLGSNFENKIKKQNGLHMRCGGVLKIAALFGGSLVWRAEDEMK